MKVSDFISEFLSKKTTHVFGGQGGFIVHIANSIDKNNKLKFIPGQNEQASSMAADAYHRVTNKLGVAIATSGPGIINLFQGIACSYFDSIPSLYITGAPVLQQLRLNKKIRQIGFQEMEVVDLVKPITKYAVLIKNPKKIKYELEKALYIANTGRKGPVLVDVPDDIQRMNLNFSKLKGFVKPIKKKAISKSFKLKIKRLYSLIMNSKKPTLVIGHGVKLSNCEKQLKKFIKKNKIPFLTTWACLDMFKFDNELNAGTFGVAATRNGNFVVQESDLLIFLGARMSPQLIGSNPKIFSPKSKKVLIDIDKNEFKNHRLPKISLKINADVFNVVKELSNKSYKNLNLNKWIYKINYLKKMFPICSDQNLKNNKHVDPYAFFYYLNQVLNSKHMIIPDASANLIWAMQGLKVDNQKIFTALNHSPMGYSVPASVGAYFGDQQKNIISIIGDGSLQMNIQELETIKNFKVNVKIFVINNKGYGLIKQTLETWLNSKYTGVDKKSGLSLPNFISISKAYGIKTFNIKNNLNLKSKLKHIINLKGPVLINVNVDPKKRVKPKIDYGNPLHEMSPKLDQNFIKSIVDI